MHKRQSTGMQGLAREATARLAAINAVSHQRMTQMRHVHPNLVRTTGVQRAAHQTVRSVTIQQIKVSARLLSRVQIQIHHCHAQAIARVTANGCADLAVLAAALVFVSDSQILATHITRSNHFDERIHGAAVARHHHQAAGVFIQPVNNACTRHLTRFFIAC